MKLLLRIIIFVLVGVGVWKIVSLSNPCYSVNDLYFVSGYCTDIQYEGGSSKSSDERVYIVLNNDERYYIYDYLWEELDVTQKSIVGSEITFFASDKAKHWHFDHLLISFGNSEDDCFVAIEKINKKNIETQAILLVIYCIVLSSLYLVPEVIRVMDKKRASISSK